MLPTHQLSLSVLLHYRNQIYGDSQCKYKILSITYSKVKLFYLFFCLKIIDDQRRNFPTAVTVE